METIHVKNFEKWYPKYQDGRTLIWCKAKFTMLNTQKWEGVPEIDKWRFIALVMLELINGEPVCNDPKYLKSQGFNLKKRPMFLTLNTLHRFVDVRDGDLKSPSRRLDKNRVEKIREDKNTYMEFVKLTDKEHKKLIERFGSASTEQRIEALNDYIGSTGKKYQSHYHTILNWERKNKVGLGNRKQKLLPIVGKTCSEKNCGLPAVYKDSSGNYDRYCCTKHLPENVKELYK